MLIFKSFLRKKTTKTYLLIYTIILSTLFTLFITKNIMVELENNNYNGSFIEIEDDGSININKLDNIDKIYHAVYIKENYNKVFFINDNSYNLKNNEIIIPIKYQKEMQVNDELELEIANNTYKFIVKDFLNSKNDNVFVVSSNIIKENDNLDKSYLLVLKNWLKKDKTFDEIKDNYKNVNISSYFYTSNDSYTTFITIINILLSILIFLFAIILIVTCFNIIQDEKKKNDIYYKLGYLKANLKKYNLLKIICLISIALIISIIVSLILYTIYNVIK